MILPNPQIGAGVDSMIHEKAVPKLLAARKKIGRIQRPLHNYNIVEINVALYEFDQSLLGT